VPFLGASSGVFFWLFVLVLESDLILARMASAVLCEEAERFDPVQEWERFSRRIGEVADSHAAFFRVSGSTVVPVPANAGPMHKTLYAPMTKVLENVRLVNAMDTSGCLQRQKDFREFFDDFSLQLLLDDVSGGQIAAASVPAEFIVRSVRLFARALTDAFDKKLLVPVVKRAKRVPNKGQQRLEPSERAVGREWRDENGRSLKWLEWMRLDVQAAAVRARYSRAVSPIPGLPPPPSERGGGTNLTDQSDTLCLPCGVPSPVSVTSESPRCSAGGEGTSHHNHIQDSGDSPFPCLGEYTSTEVAVGQPICMAWDSNTRKLLPVNSGSRTLPIYSGYVKEVIGPDSSRVCRCWFGDHTLADIPENIALQCIVRDPGPKSDLPTTLPPEVEVLVATIRRVWGEDSMPACVRDPEDGKTRSAAFLVFNHKTVAAQAGNRYSASRGSTLIVDHLGSVLVQFMSVHGDVGGVSVCSQCHTLADQTRAQLCARTGAPTSVHPCKHVAAVRYIHQHVTTSVSDNGSAVDGEIARAARRYSRPPPPGEHARSQQSPDEIGTRPGSEDDVENGERPSEPCLEAEHCCLLPTSESCFFLVLQASPMRCSASSPRSLPLHRHGVLRRWRTQGMEMGVWWL